MAQYKASFWRAHNYHIHWNHGVDLTQMKSDLKLPNNHDPWFFPNIFKFKVGVGIFALRYLKKTVGIFDYSNELAKAYILNAIFLS